MPLRTVTMAELRLEALLEAEAVGRVGGGDLPPLPDLARDVLPVSAARSRGGHRTARGSLAPPEGVAGPDRRRGGGRDLSHAPRASALGRASHPRRAEGCGLGAAGGVDDPPSAATQPSHRQSATAPAKALQRSAQNTPMPGQDDAVSARGIADRRRSDRFRSVVESGWSRATVGNARASTLGRQRGGDRPRGTSARGSGRLRRVLAVRA
jgi:hypothetical protein